MKRALTSLLALLLLLCGCQGGQKAADGDAAAEFGTHYRGSYHTVSAAACPDYFCVAGDRIYTASLADSAVIRSCALDGSGETSFAMPYVSADYFDGTPMLQSVYGMFAGYVTDERGEKVLDANGEPIEQSPGRVMVESSDGSLLSFELENMTQQQADRLTALIEGTGKLRDCDESIFTIFSEELNALFDGQQDIDQTAKAIQHRAELYIAEQGE